jgi:hypothetical protein
MHLYVMENHSGDYWWDLPFLEYDEKKYIAFDIKDMIVSWKKYIYEEICLICFNHSFENQPGPAGRFGAGTEPG